MTKAQLVRKHAQVKAQMDLLEERTAKAKEMLSNMDKGEENAKLVDALNKAKMNMERIKMHMQFFFPMMEVVASANELKQGEKK